MRISTFLFVVATEVIFFLSFSQGASNMQIICNRFPAFRYCGSEKRHQELKGAPAMSPHNPSPSFKNGNGAPQQAPFKPQPFPENTPPPQPLFTPPRPAQRLTFPTPAPKFQPQLPEQPQLPPQFPEQPPSQPPSQPLFGGGLSPSSVQQPQSGLNSPSVSQPASGLNNPSISQPLGFLGGNGASNAATNPFGAGAGTDASGSAPLGFGSNTQAGPFAGVGSGTNINPMSGVGTGTSVNAAGMPISSGSNVSFGGLMPGNLKNMFGRRRRRDISLLRFLVLLQDLQRF